MYISSLLVLVCHVPKACKTGIPFIVIFLINNKNNYVQIYISHTLLVIYLFQGLKADFLIKKKCNTVT